MVFLKIEIVMRAVTRFEWYFSWKPIHWVVKHDKCPVTIKGKILALRTGLLHPNTSKKNESRMGAQKQ